MTEELLKAIAVGVCAAVPVGPVLLMLIQKTLCGGKKAGILTGLGSAAADTVFAAVALFTTSLVGSFVERYEPWIMLFGGLVVAAVGLNIALRDSGRASDAAALKMPGKRRKAELYGAGCALQSALSALSNPGALALMIGLVAVFGLGSPDVASPVWLLAAAVFVGESAYWVLVTCLVSAFVRPGREVLRLVCRIAGTAICAFALVLFVRGLILVLK